MASYNLDVGADQRLQSPLDKVGIRRTIVHVKQEVTSLLEDYIFEPNDEMTRAAITSNISTLLQDLTNRKAIENFVVLCDERNNSPDIIDNNELAVRIRIKPRRSVDDIDVSFKMGSTSLQMKDPLQDMKDAFERAMKVVDQY
jgi:phage tail sheath protein FI